MMSDSESGASSASEEEELPQGRGPYDKIGKDQYSLIIQALGRGETPSAIAQWTNVKIRTIYSIRRRYETTGERHRASKGGRRHVKLQEEHAHALVQLLEENPLWTLQQMRQELHNRHGVEVGTSTIARQLDKQLITLKSLGRDADVPVARNSPENIARRREFVEWLLGLPADCHVIYVDETGFNLWTRRGQGRSRRGQRVRRVIHTQRGVQVNIFQAVSPILGLVHHEIIAETMTALTFQGCIGHLIARVMAREDVQDGQRFCIVMDGARFHNGVQIPEELRDTWQTATLPPYSPFLNPVECAHSCLKTVIKQQLARPNVHQELDHPPPELTLCQWRIVVLTRIAEEATDSVTAAKCGGWHREMMRFIPRCINGVPIL